MLDKDCIKEKVALWKIGSMSNEDFLCWVIDYLVEEIDKKEDKKVASVGGAEAEAEETKIE
tara:strand:+ start:8698 stop:8880 length:183 start_codon:yes stop_codon:yes gene_type:complete